LANVNIALGLTDAKCNVFIAALGENAREKAHGILCGLRKAGISCEMDYLDRSFKSQMRYADKIGASSVIIIGDNEIEKGICIIKDMAGGSQQEELLENIVPKLKQLKGNK
jgi:histidyl-tRNA synthetase